MDAYPKTLQEFEVRFANEQACVAYLSSLRWPTGFVCPRCGQHGSWLRGNGLHVCRSCRQATSVLVGTLFQDSHLPLTTWFRALWWMTNQKTGMSAAGLQRLLGLGSYRTAWLMLHKLRTTMERTGSAPLTGHVEVDETYWGASEPGTTGRGGHTKVLIGVAVERVGGGIGRLRMRVIADASQASLEAFVRETVLPGSTVHTDDWSGYGTLSAVGYEHVVKRVKGSGRAAHELLPQVHKAISLFKRWLLGTHQGAPHTLHLARYIDEFVFRFNRRTATYRGHLFWRLAQQAAAAKPAPYVTIIKGVRQSHHHNP